MSLSFERPAMASRLAIVLIFGVFFATAGIRAQAAGGPPATVDFWRPGDAGERMNIRGRVTGIDGEPVAGARISIRQADGNGTYREQYSGVVLSNEQGNYQFGSAVPGNYTGQRHVHINVYHDAYRFLNTEIHFKDDPNLVSEADPRAVFLEEGSVNGEKMMFGRFDITLVPR